MKILVTGAAGFIGFHLSKRLAERGDDVIGIDNLNDYYDVNLKLDRLKQLDGHSNFEFQKIDIADGEAIKGLFEENSFDVVVNLAAQAGVRYSLKNPHAYMDANIIGFCNILEGCRHHQVKNLVFASSSSVYGANTKQPFSESDNIDHPLALYAASKKANELMAHSYASLYKLPCTGLRFFTVYGPWGRPDMALFKFTKNMLKNEAIDVYNNGDMIRDFTYIDDIIDGILLTIDNPAKPNKNWSGDKPDPASSYAPYRIYNIGSSKPIQLSVFIDAIEKFLGKKAIKNNMPMQPGDVPSTFADVSALKNDYGYQPKRSIEEGIKAFVEWYLSYYQQPVHAESGVDKTL
ncbi:MAG: NAD-dependent epimerase [Coxiellaceae bacterium]|nr:NAD-dependent epimerase [Coxiellaceae bacterium]